MVPSFILSQHGPKIGQTGPKVPTFSTLGRDRPLPSPSSESIAALGGDHNLLDGDQCDTIRLEPALILVLEDKTEGDLGHLPRCIDNRGDFLVLEDQARLKIDSLLN
jgi:hypothetical protein